MTTLWAPGNGDGDGLFDYGCGLGYASVGNDGDPGGGTGGGYIQSFLGNGHGNDSDIGHGDGCLHSGDGFGNGSGNSNGLGGYPEQDYDGCTAISRLRIHEATLPVTDLLALAVAQ